jgi:hypothetical protein
MANYLKAFSNSRHNNENSLKYRLNCQSRIDPEDPETKSWLELTHLFKPDKSDQFRVFKGLLEKRRTIVAKVGVGPLLDKEYTIAESLQTLNLPTFLTFYCKFKCLDTIKSMNATTQSLCKKDGDPITVLIMDDVKLGQIDKFPWSRENFNMLLNVLAHITVSLLYAAKILGFAHRDLHLGNILLRRSMREEVHYNGVGFLPVLGILPIIMDYDRSELGVVGTRKTFDDIKRAFYLISVELDLKLDAQSVTNLCERCISENTNITLDLIKEFVKKIKEIKIRYVSSEIHLVSRD